MVFASPRQMGGVPWLKFFQPVPDNASLLERCMSRNSSAWSDYQSRIFFPSDSNLLANGQTLCKKRGPRSTGDKRELHNVSIIAIAKINDRYFGSGPRLCPVKSPLTPFIKGGLGGFQGTREARAIRTEFLADRIIEALVNPGCAERPELGGGSRPSTAPAARHLDGQFFSG
jgi:hypothetical protein